MVYLDVFRQVRKIFLSFDCTQDNPEPVEWVKGKMKLQIILSKIKKFINVNRNGVSAAFSVLKFTPVIAIFALIPMGTAKNEVFNSRISLNTNSQISLVITEPKTELQPGIAKADIDRLNETADPELVKKFMQEIAPAYGVDWRLVYAIGYHESGNYSSSLARRNNNFFGRKASSAGYAAWSTPEEGIRNQFEYLKTRYFDRGLTTPETINPVYAEDGSWKYAVRSVMNTL